MNYVLKTVDNRLNRGLLSFRYVKILSYTQENVRNTQLRFVFANMHFFSVSKHIDLLIASLGMRFSCLKPGLHISRKDRKHIVANVYFKLYRYGLVSKSL